MSDELPRVQRYSDRGRDLDDGRDGIFEGSIECSRTPSRDHTLSAGHGCGCDDDDKRKRKRQGANAVRV